MSLLVRTEDKGDEYRSRVQDKKPWPNPNLERVVKRYSHSNPIEGFLGVQGDHYLWTPRNVIVIDNVEETPDIEERMPVFNEPSLVRVYD